MFMFDMRLYIYWQTTVLEIFIKRLRKHPICIGNTLDES